ncbi:hypothetical protein V8E51_007911 [Hyaloscypha variabilis]
MSGLEALGAAASVVQVAQLSLALVTSLTSLYHSIRDAPWIMQARLVQVQTLIDISRRIAEQPQLQTPEVEAILMTCLRDSKALLQDLVVEAGGSKLKKWTHAMGSLIEEKRIISRLERLELAKASLTLCIVQIDSSLLDGIDTRLEVIHENLEEVSQTFKKELTLIRRVIEGITTRDFDVSQVRTDACLKSLAVKGQGPFPHQTLRKSKPRRGWLFANPNYISWNESEESSLLLITANPGFGKTTLAAHVCQQIRIEEMGLRDSGSHDEVKSVLIYYFFRRSNQDNEGAASTAFRTILDQFLQQVPDQLDTILEHHHPLSTGSSFEWSCEKLQDVIDCMLKKLLGSKVYIILDALDECDEDSKHKIQDWVHGLVDDREPFSVYSDAQPTLKVLVMSSPDENVFDRLSNFPTLEITETDTAEDMYAFIQNRTKDLSARRNLKPEVTRSIARFLEENARGMFLWVVLILDELSRRDERLSDEAIASKLSRIPLTLVNTYEAILQSVAPARRNDMWRIIRWLLYGKRGLTIAELEQGICLEPEITRWYDFAGDLKLLCGSLVRLERPRGNINLIHQTARDFLQSFAENATLLETGGIEMDFAAANRCLAEVCVQYLLQNRIFDELFEAVNPPDTDTVSAYQNKMEVFLSRHPFLCYATESWAFHLRAIEIPPSPLADMVRQLISCQIRRDGIMRLTYFILYQGNPHSPRGSSPVHLASYFNLPWLVKLCISEDPNSVHSVCFSRDTPLIWAAEMGSVACAEMLLDAGTDPNKVEWDGWSALHWAARNGHLAVTKLLLEHRANLEQHDSKGLTPQDWAAGSGYCDVFEALEQRADYVRKSKLDSIMREKCPMSDTVVSGSVGDWKQISNDHRFSFGSRNEFGFDVH